MTNAIYLRISFDPLKLGVGVDRQRVDCEQLSTGRFPNTPTIIYQDNDKSAYSGVKRPAYEQMLTDIRAGTISTVIAWNLDRLLRQPRQLEQLIDLNVPVVTAQGDLDLTSHDGQLQGRILAAVAKKSSDDTSRRVKRAAQDRREDGRWVGGRISYPYQQSNCQVTFRSLDSRTTARLAVDLFLDGHSLRHIAATCSLADPLAPRTDRGWRWILLSPALAGINTHGMPGNWEPVITQQEHARILAILHDPARNTRPGSRARTYWLSGIVKCGKCHGGMYPALETRTRVPVVRCQTCGMVVRRAYLDSAVAEKLFVVAPRSVPVQAVETPLDTGEDRIRLTEMAALYVKGLIAREVWDAALLAAPPAPTPVPVASHRPPLPEDLRTAWFDGDGMSDHRKHEIARYYLHYVSVQSAPRNGGKFDLSRVVAHWKEGNDSL